MRKSVFLVTVILLIGGAIGAWLFFSTAILGFVDDTGFFSPQKTPIHTGTDAGTGVISTGGKNEDWDPTVIRTQGTVDAGSGITITVSTNGPRVRSMTPEEQAAFQKQIEGK